MDGYLDIKTVSLLTGEADRRIREKVTNGTYQARRQQGGRGGNSGESYQIAVSSLPAEAQIRHLRQTGVLVGRAGEACDLTAYREKYGETGIQELLERQRAAEAGITIRRMSGRNTGRLEKLEELAAGLGISLRQLYRWMDGYEAEGLAGLMRTVKRKDKGRLYSICPAAHAYAYGLYMTQTKRKKTVVHQMTLERAAELGAGACTDCLFREG